MLATLRTTKSSPGRVENDFRRDARVAAADHHDFRRLPALRELAVAVLLAAQTRAEKRAMSFDETLGKRHAGPVNPAPY
jgi:hypothetical protein